MSENNVKSKDLHLINDLNAALQKEKHSGQFWVIILFFLLLVVFVVWAYNSTVEEVTRGNGNVIPSSREQVIQSLDAGVITQMMVKEGDLVEKDQILLKLDDTRSLAVLRESEAKVQNLEATIAPPANAKPNDNTRGLGVLENITNPLPNTVNNPAARVMPKAVMRLGKAISSMKIGSSMNSMPSG